MALETGYAATPMRYSSLPLQQPHRKDAQAGFPEF
jgi:hypothetical protein